MSWFALALWLLPAPAAGQILRGRVVADTVAVAEAEVVATDPAGIEKRTLTDGQGLFAMVLPASGLWMVRASHGGFGPVSPQPVQVGAYEDVSLEIQLTAAIPLSPIEITARRRYARSALRAGIEERLAWAERTGLGHIMRRDDLDRTPVIGVQDLLLQIPRVGVTNSGTSRRVWFTRAAGNCAPQVYVDGVRDVTRQGILDELSPGDLEAVEVYRGSMEAPPEYMDPGGCGVILLWTRRDAAGGKRWTWKRLLAVGGIVGLMVWTVR